ncbi:hypothetical protein [Vibrio crassostreae]|uniref:hypothetical protein n=1 Tax=Vibrio crassostreae TaxID=246167 RepID=UPI001B316717|nr:hypothetical protein [Vibrio crassostreae]
MTLKQLDPAMIKAETKQFRAVLFNPTFFGQAVMATVKRSFDDLLPEDDEAPWKLSQVKEIYYIADQIESESAADLLDVKFIIKTLNSTYGAMFESPKYALFFLSKCAELGFEMDANAINLLKTLKHENSITS